MTLSARGSELEQDFADGIVRQLFEVPLVAAPPPERAGLLAGAAGHAATLFGLAAARDDVADDSWELYHMKADFSQGRFDKQVRYRFTVNETFDIGCRLLCGQLVRGVVNIPSALRAVPPSARESARTKQPARTARPW
jgi:hypothetical protein